MSAPLYGLVLTGGRSTRMGEDKAALRIGGRTQLERAMALVAPHVERAFVSVRPDQRDDPLRAGFEQIADTRVDLGPIAGILAAQERFPDKAWLVLACDLPLLDAATLAFLLRKRAPRRLATAFRSSHDGLPEPLCAVYEPASRPHLLAYVDRGRQCPRKFLMGADVELLEEPQPHALDNANTPEEHATAVNVLEQSNATAAAAARRLTVQYYAVLREQAGRREESLVSCARTAHELYRELAQRHPFSLDPTVLRVAINGEFGDWTAPLKDGDSVVFIPPVAGG
ncbi:MAG TPA: NTP transferase domain-containing protein [Steroidobacteraceae bacterium]|nr:NTP transferase domain-containing protein [Steroidobacteraceae bacterium]